MANKNKHHGMMNSGKISKADMKKGISVLSSSLKKYSLPILIAAIFLLGNVFISVFSPSILSDLSDEIALGSSNIDLNKVNQLGLTLAILYVISTLLSFLSGFIMTTISQRFSQDLRSQIIDKINKLPLKYFDSTSTGDILSRITNDVDTIGQSLQQSLSMLIQSVFLLIGSIIAMLITSLEMAGVCILSIPVMVILLAIVLKFSGPQFKKRQDLIGDVDGIVEENYNGLFIIKLFNAEERTKENFNKSNDKLKTTMFKSEVLGGLMQPIMSLMSYIDYALVCLVGGLLMNANAGVTFGTISAFLVYVNLFQSPLSQIAQAFNSLQSGIASANRVFDFLAEKELIDESDKKRYLLSDDFNKVKGEVIFDNVGFGYNENKEIIHSFSCAVKPGMKVAIVGSTGAGKTTMVNLLMRFYEINKGKISIDGVLINEMSREEIHDIFAMVLQDTWMFAGTLRENLIYNTKNITDEEINTVLEKCGLLHFVNSLPNGLDYYIKDDNELSGGQKQLLTIARAMLKKAPLLILDEATSNVDTRTEEVIQESMDELTVGRTSFVIAHRLSTIKNADIILVMQNGNIIEQGSHDELMKKNGFYCSLYNSQFQLD